jgi:hypothetical protein
MRLEHEIKTQPRLLRKSDIGGADPAPKGKKPEARGKAKGTRFVGATHLDERQKAQISQALKKQRIGDDMGREIFVCALEYQLTVFGPQLERRQQPDPAVLERQAALARTLREVADRAQALSSLLRELPELSKSGVLQTLAAQDNLRRGYDERYLCELGREIDRMERASATAADNVQAEVIRDNPAPSRDFVAKLAKVYAECFEAEPTAEADGGFGFALETLGEVTGLVIGHEPAFLAEILPQG